MSELATFETHEDDLLTILTETCVTDARIIRDCMAARGLERLPLVYSTFVDTALASFDAHNKPESLAQIPEERRRQGFQHGVSIRLMDTNERWGKFGLSVRELDLPARPIGIYYAVAYDGETYERFRYGIDPGDSLVLSTDRFESGHYYKPRVDEADVSYVRILLQDTAANAGIALPVAFTGSWENLILPE